MKTLLILLSITCLITAQGPGNGISKSTWGASDPQKCLKFNEKYLPMTTSGDSCKNGKCECATQGRAQLNADWSPGPLNGFGVHAINCTYHPYGEMSLMDVEEKFAENFNGFKAYHPFMDFNAGFWMKKSMVNTLISEFQKDGVDFLPLKWTSDDGNEYYSILFSPCGFVVLEIITDEVDQASIFQQHDASRFSFAQRNNKPTEHKDYMTPLKVSRATERLDAVKAFYTEKIASKMLKTETLSDGAEVATFMYDSVKKGVQLQYWQGRKAVEEIAGSMDVKTLEDFINDVHKTVMTTPTCGFDQWIDNHYAIDFGPGQGNAPSLDDFADHFKSQGLAYHWLQVNMGGAMTQLYGADPTGWAIQIDGQANNPPSNMPYYSASCKSNDGCSGQGLCNSKAELKQFLRDISVTPIPEYNFEQETTETTELAETSPVAFVDHQWLIITLSLLFIALSAGGIIYYVKRKRAQKQDETVLDSDNLITDSQYLKSYEPPQKNQVQIMQ